MKTLARLLTTAVALTALAPVAYAQEEPKSIAGAKEFEHQIPRFGDLPKWDPNYRAPRTADGRPDLQGVWSDASQTQLTRSTGNGGARGIRIDTLVIPDEELQKHLAQNYYVQAYKVQGQKSDLDDDLLEDRDANRGYNAFWIDPGAEFGRVNGEWRSSWIVSPANGQIPYSADGRQVRGSRMAAFRSNSNTGPEARTIGDRCLMSYAGQAGPPMVNGMYNNHHQIVQTPSAIMINTEMNHDARIISIGGTPRPDAVKQWFGDSVGRWEGETLVVETSNLHPTQAQGGGVPLSPKGKVIERFTRKSPVEILYEFTVDDPLYYTEVWKGEMPLRLSKANIYEYACHEGNYSLPGMLRGDAMGKDTAIAQEGE